MDDRRQPSSSDHDDPLAAGEREVRFAELRAAVGRGLEDIKAGRVADLEQAFDRIEAMLDELEAGKRG